MSEPAAIAETHISVVFFVGDRAYKLKKPVSLGFLDFSTREARAAACHREVELNRRLAPDVYLGVLDVIGPDGQACDHVVAMRRMPVDRRLSRLVREQAVDDSEIDRLARVIAAFHQRTVTSPKIAEAGTVDQVRHNWDQSFEQLQPFMGTVLDEARSKRVEELVHRYLAGRSALFEHRVAHDRVRDGHGDLLADDVFLLDDGPRILDCIEFDDRLRHCDVLADVAFLAMDLERLGAPGLAARFLSQWAEYSAETHPASLAHHYIAYRAHVRAKVACIRAGQGDDAARTAAVDHLQLAIKHLERGRVALVLVGGLPGTGKSTLAEGIGRARGWTVLHSDEVRKQLAGVPGDARAPAAFGEGLYTPEVTARTYEELLRRSRRALELGESVVLDATWSARRWREAAADVAAATASELIPIRCVAPLDVTVNRLSNRTERFGSDAIPTVAEAMTAVADPWPSAWWVNTDRPPRQVLDETLELLPPLDSRFGVA